MVVAKTNSISLHGVGIVCAIVCGCALGKGREERGRQKGEDGGVWDSYRASVVRLRRYEFHKIVCAFGVFDNESVKGGRFLVGNYTGFDGNVEN